MEKKEQRILRRAEDAGLKLVRKNGRVPTREELLQTKIQVLPWSARWSLFFGSVVSGITCWYFLNHDMITAGSVAAVVSVFLLLFSIFGIKRTLGTLAEQFSYGLVDVVFEAIGDAFGSILG